MSEKNVQRLEAKFAQEKETLHKKQELEAAKMSKGSGGQDRGAQENKEAAAEQLYKVRLQTGPLLTSWQHISKFSV